MSTPRGHKVFRAIPRQMVQQPVVRTSLVHGSGVDVQPQDELCRLLVPAAGLLRNGTVVASESGKLVLEIRSENSRSMTEINVEAGSNLLDTNTRVTRGEIILVTAMTAFSQIDLSFQLLESEAGA